MVNGKRSSLEIVGHRGAKGLAPENTLRSLQTALKHGVDMIEFDVRVTKDGLPILHHSRTLNDPSGQKLKIGQHNFKELKAHDPDLATLAEALDYIDNKSRPWIEVKRGEPVQPVVKVIDEFLRSGMYSPRDLLVGSKSQSTLREIHAALPEVPTVVIEPWSGVRAHYRARQIGTTIVAMNQLWLWRGFIAPVSRGGWKLYAYTLNDPTKAKRWAGYGLTGVITDYPDRFEA